MTTKTFACCSALLLGACAGVPVHPPAAAPCPPAVVATAVPAPAPMQGQALAALLVFQAGLRQLKPAQLARLLAEPDAEPGAAASMLRRAMLLAALRGNGDLARAQALLDSVVAPATPDGPALKALAQSLSAAAGEARRRDEAQDRLALQLRDAQRRNEQLAEKLEALKSIERALSVRAPGPAGASK